MSFKSSSVTIVNRPPLDRICPFVQFKSLTTLRRCSHAERKSNLAMRNCGTSETPAGVTVVEHVEPFALNYLSRVFHLSLHLDLELA